MRKREARMGFFLALPILCGVAVFYAAPLCVTVWFSFTFGAGGSTFVGLSNYSAVLQNPRFQLAAGNTAKFLGLALPAVLLLSLFLSLLLRRLTFGSRFLKLAFLYPMMVPAASSVMVLDIFLSDAGILNDIFLHLGLPMQEWLQSGWAFWILILLYLWKNTGYSMILLSAGLQMIPDELYSAASLDGAGAWQKLRCITLPLLLPSLFFAFVISLLNAFKCFREAFLLGGDHPDDSIYLLQHFMNNNFQNLNYPRLAVAAVVVFAVIFAVTGTLYGLWQRAQKRGDSLD